MSIKVSGTVECYDDGTDGECYVVFDKALPKKDINTCKIIVFDHSNEQFLAMHPLNEDLPGKCNFILDNNHTKFLKCWGKHQESDERGIPVFSMFDQPVSKLFLEKCEPHFAHEQNDLLCMHLCDCGHVVVNINFPPAMS